MQLKWTYKERAEEDERDKVRNGDIAAALSGFFVGWRLLVAFSASHTRQHDLLPTLTRSTPNNQQTHNGSLVAHKLAAGHIFVFIFIYRAAKIYD